MMKGTNTQVNQILHKIPTNSIGAEIGIWKGATSRKFLEKNLSHFHMVDPYSMGVNSGRTLEQKLDRYKDIVGSKNPEDFQEYYDRLYLEIEKEFGSKNNVTVHRSYSKEFFDSIEDNYLDWIYIDGDHTYEGCLFDLQMSLKKVKSGGSIFGDDYRNHRGGGKAGVIKAVSEFASKQNLKLIPYGLTQFEFKVP